MKNNEFEIQNQDNKNKTGNGDYRPSEKSPHIVFQVINFISGDSPLNEQLIPSDRLLLIMLAKHKGKKGIYPSMPTLAKELHVSRRQILYCLERLEFLKVIQVERKIGKSNHYTFPFLSTDQCSTVHGCHVVHPCSTVHGLGDENAVQNLPTREVHFADPCSTLHSISINNQQRVKAERERAPKNGASPSVSKFKPSEENVRLASEWGIDLEEELESFAQIHKRDKTDYEFKRWLRKARNYKADKPKIPEVVNIAAHHSHTRQMSQEEYDRMQASYDRINAPAVYDRKPRNPMLAATPQGKLETFLNDFPKSGNTGR